MPKIQDFRIEFERPGATYTCGETVAGNVILNLYRSKNVREIRFEARGEAGVRWNQTEDTSTKEYRGFQHYFYVSNRLIGNATGDVRTTSQTTLPAGQHSYHFKFQLPINIPCSMEHEFGHVRYTVSAILARPWRFDHQVIKAFSVVTHYDLNAHQELTTGINDAFGKRFHTCCNLRNAGTLRAQVYSRVSGFVPGETIELNVNYNIDSNSVELKKINLSLYKFLDFHASLPLQCKKTNSDFINTVQQGGHFSKKGVTPIKIQIPPLPPSKLEYCSIINVRYKLVLYLYMSGDRVVNRIYPIEIGTIPFYYQMGNPTQSSISASTSSAPPIDQLNAPIGSDIMSTPSNTYGVVQPMPETPPPSYEECMFGSNSIADQNKKGMHGPNVQFAPKYPVYKFPLPNKFRSLDDKQPTRWDIGVQPLIFDHQ